MWFWIKSRSLPKLRHLDEAQMLVRMGTCLAKLQTSISFLERQTVPLTGLVWQREAGLCVFIGV